MSMVYPDPFRLRVLKAIAESLSTIGDPATAGEQPWQFDLRPTVAIPTRVYRGRMVFGDNDPLPMLSIIEPPLPIDRPPTPTASTAYTGQWELLIQGWAEEDQEHPTDPAHCLMADVKRQLAFEQKRVVSGSRQPNPFGFGKNQNGVGNHVIDLVVGPGVVRPAEIGLSDIAFFWLNVTMKITEDNEKPFL